MKTILFFLTTLLTFAVLNAQDYFSIVKKNDDVTYNYPENSILTLYDADGTSQRIEKGDAIAVTGDYRLEIDVFWKDEPDVVQSDGGLLEVFVVESHGTANWQPQENTDDSSFKDSEAFLKPVLERKSIAASKNNNGLFNALFVFSNAMVFQYEDGEAKAYEDGEMLDIQGKYIIEGKNEVLKLSYNPKNGEMWYVFEKNKK